MFLYNSSALYQSFLIAIILYAATLSLDHKFPSSFFFVPLFYQLVRKQRSVETAVDHDRPPGSPHRSPATDLSVSPKAEMELQDTNHQRVLRLVQYLQDERYVYQQAYIQGNQGRLFTKSSLVVLHHSQTRGDRRAQVHTDQSTRCHPYPA